jgi:hypothetical protein
VQVASGIRQTTGRQLRNSPQATQGTTKIKSACFIVTSNTSQRRIQLTTAKHLQQPMPLPKPLFTSFSRWLTRLTVTKGSMPKTAGERDNNVILYALGVMGLIPKATTPPKPPGVAISQAYISANGRLNATEISTYRAAGALVIARTKQDGPVVMLVQEQNKPKGSMPVATIPGGKIDENEDQSDPLATCRREVWEETCGLLDIAKPRLLNSPQLRLCPPDANDVLSNEQLQNVVARSAAGCLWAPASKYALFVVEASETTTQNDSCKENDWLTISNVFEQTKRNLDDSWRHEHSMEKTLGLHWVSLATLVNHVSPIPEKIVVDDGDDVGNKEALQKEECKSMVERPTLVDIDGNSLTLHRFATSLLRSPPGRELLRQVALGCGISASETPISITTTHMHASAKPASIAKASRAPPLM